MKSRHTLQANSIVLTRTNYGEADRIATLLTDKEGKVRVIVKGARRHGSKLAAGVELLSISEVSYIPSGSELALLVSARLSEHYTRMLSNLERVEFAFECLKQIHKVTEDTAGNEYFLLLKSLFESLDVLEIDLLHIQCWWYVRLLKLTGHSINGEVCADGEQFDASCTYIFDMERGGFLADSSGQLSSLHIKYIKLASMYVPQTLSRITDGQNLAATMNVILKNFAERVH